jgi:transposase
MMVVDISAVTIYVRPGVTDLRKAINGLSVIASEQMEADPLSGSLFLFCNRYRRVLKCLYWDRNGFCLWHKRLERDRFPWPQSEEQITEIGGEQLKMLLDGIDFRHAHQKILYSSVV